MRRAIFSAAAVLLSLASAPAAAAQQQPHQPQKAPVAEGYGGAVATVDLDATKAAISVLRKGGNAVDAAVAAGAVLGVTEPYSAGLAGGGFMVYYDAEKNVRSSPSTAGRPRRAP
ncbi:gamma-glutamyltransferase [Nonomuraea salmonea]|uniref:gamma-glutamyltransferase n=1 Tax=Nonomuraea salmonea TaxID=46181 RepID=UPI002FECBD25